MFSVFLVLLVLAASPALVAASVLGAPAFVAASPAVLSSPNAATTAEALPAFDQEKLGICWACAWAAVAAQNSRFCRDLDPLVLKDGLATFSTNKPRQQPSGSHQVRAHPTILTNLRRAVAAESSSVPNKVRPEKPFTNLQIKLLERCVATMRVVTIPMQFGNGLPRLPLGGRVRLPGNKRGLPGNRSDRFADKVERHLPVCPKDGRRSCREGGRPFIFNFIFTTYAAVKKLGSSGRLPNPKEDTAAEMTGVSCQGHFAEIVHPK